MGVSKNLVKDDGREGIQAGVTTNHAGIKTSLSSPLALGLLPLPPVGSTQMQAQNAGGLCWAERKNAGTQRDKQKDLTEAETTGRMGGSSCVPFQSWGRG